MFRPRLNCSAFGCDNSTAIRPDLLYFELPDDDKKRKQWLKLILRKDLKDEPAEGIVVCEQHFDANSIIRDTELNIVTLDNFAAPYIIYLKKSFFSPPSNKKDISTQTGLITDSTDQIDADVTPKEYYYSPGQRKLPDFIQLYMQTRNLAGTVAKNKATFRRGQWSV